MMIVNSDYLFVGAVSDRKHSTIVHPLAGATLNKVPSVSKEMELRSRRLGLKGHCIYFKYYADGIHYGLTPPG